MSAPRRGEVWLTDFPGQTKGHEQAGVRPALVLSVDSFNASRAGLVAVLPITTKPFPGNVFRIEVRPPEGGATKVGYVIGEQTWTVSTLRLIKLRGIVSNATMRKVADVVRTLLGL
jgi:mRNA interferase MazF